MGKRMAENTKEHEASFHGSTAMKGGNDGAIAGPDALMTPDNLGKYIKVSKPSVWLVMLAVFLVLISLCLWAAFGTVKQTVPCVLSVSNNEAVCYMRQSDAKYMKVGNEVEVKGADIVGHVSSVFSENYKMPENLVNDVIADDQEGRVGVAFVRINLPDGIYDGYVTVVTFHPMDLIFPKKG